MSENNFSKEETDIPSLRINQLINAVNNDRAPETINPALTRYEMYLYKSFSEELAEMRKERPQAAFWPVESDWD